MQGLWYIRKYLNPTFVSYPIVLVTLGLSGVGMAGLGAFTSNEAKENKSRHKSCESIGPRHHLKLKERASLL